MSEKIKKEETEGVLSPVPEFVLSQNTVLRVGDILRQARLEKKQDLKEVASYLCIRHQFLKAIENNEQKELPGETYALGFVRTYAAYLGLDPEDLVARYKAENALLIHEKKERLKNEGDVPENTTPSAKIILLSIFLLILVYIFWTSSSKDQKTDWTGSLKQQNTAETQMTLSEPLGMVQVDLPAPFNDSVETGGVEQTNASNVSKPIPPVPSEKPMLPDAEVNPSVDPIEVAEGLKEIDLAIPVADKKKDVASVSSIRIYGQRTLRPRIVLVANEDAWVEVTRGETIVLSRVLKTGDRFQASNDTTDLYLKTGNAGGLDIFVDGVRVPRIGPKGATRTNIPVNPEYLIPKTSVEN